MAIDRRTSCRAVRRHSGGGAIPNRGPLGRVVWIHLRNSSSSVRERGSTVTKRPVIAGAVRPGVSRPAPGATVGAAEADGGAVVVELIELQGERLADRQGHIGAQGRTVGIKKPVEGAPQAVIAEMLHLLRRDAEH